MDDDDPITAALQSRRIPHGRGARHHNAGGGGYVDGAFDPVRSFGRYEVQLGRSRNQKSRKAARPATEAVDSWLEIHELTAGDDGLLGSFHFTHGLQSLQAMCVMAGSRKGLAATVKDLERRDEPERDEIREMDEKSERGDVLSGDIDLRSDNGAAGSGSESRADIGDASSNEGDEEVDSEEGSTSATPSSRNVEHRHQGFAKNTFRDPKFWMRWKGHAADIAVPNSNDGTAVDTVAQTELGYLVFASNRCDRFDGTISCKALEWKNLKIIGRKSRPKGTPCPLEWTDL